MLVWLQIRKFPDILKFENVKHWLPVSLSSPGCKNNKQWLPSHIWQGSIDSQLELHTNDMGSGNSPDWTTSTPCSHQHKIRRAKMTLKNRKKLINIISWSAECTILRAEGFSCSLTSFMEAKGQVNCNFRSKKDSFLSYNFCLFLSSKPWIWIRIHLKCWIRIRIQWMNESGSATVHKIMHIKNQDFMMHSSTEQVGLKEA